MKISYQSSEGHTTLTDLTDREVRAKFRELTRSGYRAFAGTGLDDSAGPVKCYEEIPQDTEELFFIAPLVGG